MIKRFSKVTAITSCGIIVLTMSAYLQPEAKAVVRAQAGINQPVINNVVHIQNLGLGQKVSDDVNRLQDIQIGENGRFLRVVLFCRVSCNVSERSNGYFLEDIKDEIMIDIVDQSKNAQRLTMISEKNGSLLAISSQKSVLRSSVKRCKVQNANAVCIDLEYAAEPFQSESFALKKTNDIKDITQNNFAPSIKPSLSEENAVLSSSNEKPALRSGAVRNVGQPLSNIPIRPFDNKDNVAVTPVLAATAAPSSLRNGSILRPVETKLVLSRVDFREYSETILGKRFDNENCNQAKEKLQSDAWALDAMQTVGFCVGAMGNFEQAETIFKTLLIQDDKNFEAMIGRGLIARVTGEKSVSKRFFDDALKTSLPKKIEIRMKTVLADL